MFNKGDSVRYVGPCRHFPVDSRLAERYLDRAEVYVVERVAGSLPPHVELKLRGVAAPLVSVLFKKV